MPSASIDAFPSLPPTAQPDHIVLDLKDGTTIWAKPSYGSDDCRNYVDCRRAKVLLNPTWNQCRPQGDAFDVATADGKFVLDSSVLVVTESADDSTAYIGFACGHGIAASSFAVVAHWTEEGDCLFPPESSKASQAGVTIAASMELAATYFLYRASYDRSVQCEIDAAGGAAGRVVSCY